MGNIGTELTGLRDMIQLHAGGGNTTFIMEAAKKNPKCKILFAKQVMATLHEQEYKKWFIEKNKREPKIEETPHFCCMGGVIYHSKFGTRVPFLIDNSCLEFELLEKHNAIIYKTAFEKTEGDYRRHLEERGDKIARIRDIVRKHFFIFRRKNLLTQIGL